MEKLINNAIEKSQNAQIKFVYYSNDSCEKDLGKRSVFCIGDLLSHSGRENHFIILCDKDGFYVVFGFNKLQSFFQTH